MPTVKTRRYWTRFRKSWGCGLKSATSSQLGAPRSGIFIDFNRVRCHRTLRKDFDDAPGQLPFALDRLIRVGVGAQHDRFAAVRALCEFVAQQLGRVGLREQPRLEVQPWRHVPVRVAGARIAVDAAMLATQVGIDRLRKGQVGRLVAGDDGFRRPFDDDGSRRRPFVIVRGWLRPTVVDRFPRVAVVTRLRPQRGAAALDDVDRMLAHRDMVGFMPLSRHPHPPH